MASNEIPTVEEHAAQIHMSIDGWAEPGVPDTFLDLLRQRDLDQQRLGAERMRERIGCWLDGNGQPGYAAEIRALPPLPEEPDAD